MIWVLVITCGALALAVLALSAAVLQLVLRETDRLADSWLPRQSEPTKPRLWRGPSAN